jgi:hypothetical protein
VEVQLGPVGSLLSSLAPGSLAGVVLAGVVDRAPVEDLVDLVETALDRLRAGGSLVVLCQGTAGWSDAALDLVAGRPLGLRTWALLLGRLGCGGVETTSAIDAGLAGPEGWAVVGRR